MPRKPRKDSDHSEVWTRVNDAGERAYIAVEISDGRVVSASNAYATAADARTALRLYGEQATWVARNRDSFEVVR